MTTRQFFVEKEEDTFQLGRLEGEPEGGAYVSAQFIDRLREITAAATLRLDAGDNAAVADAVKNLMGVVTRLTTAHAEQRKLGTWPGTVAERAELALAQKELEDAARALRRFRPPGDDSSDV
jgi:hypothetical protein